MKRILSCLLLAACLCPGGPVQARPVMADEIQSITLSMRPVWGDLMNMTYVELVFRPDNLTMTFYERRMQDGSIACHSQYALTGEQADALVSAIHAASFYMLPETLETDVLDGHDTRITVTHHSGFSYSSGGLVAETEGPAAFQALCGALESVYDEVIAHAPVMGTLVPVLISEYFSDDAGSPVQEVLFVTAEGEVRVAVLESASGHTGDLGTLLRSLSFPENSAPWFSLTPGEMDAIRRCVGDVSGQTVDIRHCDGDAGLLRRYAVREDGASALLLSMEGKAMGRREDDASLALCALLDTLMPSAAYFGDDFGYQYTGDDLTPLSPPDDPGPWHC